jgi:hypothetical protein
MGSKAMKNILLFQLLLLTILMLTACSETAPECNNSITKKTVVSIAVQKYGIQLAQMGRNENAFSVVNTRTIRKEDGKCFCAAELVFDLGGDMKRNFAIEYISELTDDGNPYVTLYGL